MTCCVWMWVRSRLNYSMTVVCPIFELGLREMVPETFPQGACISLLM